MSVQTDTATILDMHSYCRPHGSATESAFLDQYVRNLPGVFEDDSRNLHVILGDSRILFSCHTDTVHRAEGRQTLTLSRLGTLGLSKRSRRTSSCLGADDTAGVWLCREMILAGVPGHYVFHYGEESGCIGSQSLADYEPEFLSGFDTAIAFDRAGYADIITHQLGRRTASDDFAHSLAGILNQSPHLQYQPSSQGIYTDTESYAHLIPECTNVSIGYSGAHTPHETLDVGHLIRLRDALISAQWADLVIARDCSAVPLEEDDESVSVFGTARSWLDDDEEADLDLYEQVAQAYHLETLATKRYR